MRRTWPSSRERRHRTLLVSGLVLLVVAVGVAVVVVRLGEADPGPEFCAGVGMIGAPVASSSGDAFAAWLAENPNEPPIEDWERRHATSRRESGRRSVSYESTASRRYWRVTVGTGGMDEDGGRLGLDEWQVDGACVGTSRRLTG